jgi:integrase
MSTRKTRRPEGVETHHRKSCRSRAGGRCNCEPSYRAKITLPDGRPFRSKRLTTEAAAVNWRIDQLAALNHGTLVEPVRTTLRAAADEFITDAKAGHTLNRKGQRYRPSVLRDYEGDLRRHVLPTLGDKRLSDIRRGDVQRLIDDLQRSGLAPSTIRNALDPVRRIFDRAVRRELIPFTPCQHLELPRGTGTRERVATPAEAIDLIAALPYADRALWATAFYAGLRMGELRGLRWCDIDLDAGAIHVRRTWDDVDGAQEGGKTRAATRAVALIAELRPILLAHKLATGRRDEDLAFGRTSTEAHDRTTIRRRARRAWIEAGLRPITPHECRHTFGSLLAAAGVDVGERQRQMGHTSSAMMDRYTHGLDGSVIEAGRRLQAWLDEQRSAAG